MPIRRHDVVFSLLYMYVSMCMVVCVCELVGSSMRIAQTCLLVKIFFTFGIFHAFLLLSWSGGTTDPPRRTRRAGSGLPCLAVAFFLIVFSVLHFRVYNKNALPQRRRIFLFVLCCYLVVALFYIHTYILYIFFMNFIY